jgi:hypothetical protein
MLRKAKQKTHPNVFAYILYLIQSLPLNLTLKYLYPRLYRVDDLVDDSDDPVPVKTP